MINRKELHDRIIKNAGKKYQELKMAKNPYVAPELIPDTIPSDQIRAIAIAIVDEFVHIVEGE